LEEIQRRTNGATGSWLPARRRAAFERFEALGFPTLKHEAWRHTDVGPIARTVFGAAPAEVPLPQPGDVATAALAGVRGPVLVVVNGRFVPELSQLAALPRGVRVESLAAALAAGAPAVQQHLGQIATLEEYPFTALNTALLEDGAFVHLGRGVVLEEPIQLVFFAVPGAVEAPPFETHPRVLVVAEEGSQAVVAESWTGTGVYLSNAVTEIVVGPGAAVTHCKVQRESKTGFHVARVRAALERNARFESYALAFGAAIARTEVDVVFGAEGGECRLGGLYAVAGKQLSDNQTFVDHTQPHCTSNQLYKGILTGDARAVFNGRVVVRPQAQKTVAHQTNRNLLLSERALVDTKPQLEIYADDVQCTHGATIGRLQEEQVFYLLSRGIGRVEATDILMQAFARDVVSQARPEAVRAALEGWIGCRMAALGSVGGGA
jgi:Fe-S cluster assembly protein SufD